MAPAGVRAPVQYGPNLRALAAYLVVYQHVPVERAVELIADVTGAPALDRLDQLGDRGNL